jgi:hypothetical protein
VNASDVTPSFDLPNGRFTTWDFSDLSDFAPAPQGALPESFSAQVFGGFQAAVPEEDW